MASECPDDGNCSNGNNRSVMGADTGRNRAPVLYGTVQATCRRWLSENYQPRIAKALSRLGYSKSEAKGIEEYVVEIGRLSPSIP